MPEQEHRCIDPAAINRNQQCRRAVKIRGVEICASLEKGIELGIRDVRAPKPIDETGAAGVAIARVGM